VRPLTLVALVAVVALVLALGAAGWVLRTRPLATFAFLGERALARAGMTRVTVETPGGRVAYWRGGTGATIALLHGAGDRAASWARVAPRLVRRFHLVIPDLPGHGRSEPASGPISFAAILGGVRAVLDAEAENRPVTLVGNSLGAWVAMVIAHDEPQRVRRLVAVDGGALRAGGDRARILPSTRAEARESVALTRDPGSRPVPDFVLDDIVREAQQGALARFASTSDSLEAWLLDGRLGEISTPVELVWGASDRLVPLSYAERMAAELPGAHLTVIPSCGHVPQVECPDAFLDALLPLLEGDRS
jgi:pimeloyl-ACP methyl ester carboxylesterase